MKLSMLSQFVVVFCFLSTSVLAEELTLNDGHHLIYKSVYNMDSEGISFEVKNGITHIPWKSISEKDAEKLSKGTYQDLIKKHEQTKKLKQSNSSPPKKIKKSTLPIKPMNTDEYEEEQYKKQNYRYM